MLLDADESQLLLVDYQERLMPSIHEREAVLRNALRLGRHRPAAGGAGLGHRGKSERLGANPPELRALCRKTLAKMHFSACADGLTELLRAPARAAQGGNARSLPKHLQKAPQPPSRAQHAS